MKPFAAFTYWPHEPVTLEECLPDYPLIEQIGRLTLRARLRSYNCRYLGFVLASSKEEAQELYDTIRCM